MDIEQLIEQLRRLPKDAMVRGFESTAEREVDFIGGDGSCGGHYVNRYAVVRIKLPDERFYEPGYAED